MDSFQFNPLQVDECADAVADALARGPVVVPLLGGYVVLATDPAALRERYGVAFRLTVVLDDAAGRVARTVFDRGACVRLAVGAWDGYAPVREPLAAAILNRVPEVGVGVPDEADEPDDFEDAGVVLTVTDGGRVGPGPTVVDSRIRPVKVDRKGALAILELEQESGETVQLGPGLVFSVLVVCTGNACRSPMAHGLLARMIAAERAFVYSAGTDAPVGAPATRAAVEAAAELGADIAAHRAQQLTPALLRPADLVLVMEKYHRQRVADMLPEAAVRTRLLGEYLSDAAPGREIEDPVGRSLEFYRQTAVLLRQALEPVAAGIRQRFRPDG
jgi:protein-tyrosine phosphatase